MRTGILLIILLAVTSIANAQQDPQFSQNMFNHMSINPAFAGERGSWVISGIYRNQWQKMDGAPETYVFNVDAPLRIRNVYNGIGLSLMNDKLGMQSNLHLMLNYSYKWILDWGMLSLGAKVGIINSKIEGEYYIPDGDGFEDPENDPALSENVSKMMFDFGAGIFLSGEKYYVGISMSHLNKPELRMGQNGVFFFARHMYLTGGYTLALSPNVDLQPSVFVNTDFVSSQYNVNTSVIVNKIYWGGVSYRYEESVSFMGGLELKNGLAVGYSYDWNVGRVGKYTGGSHEITMSYRFGLKIAKKQKIYKSVRFL